MYCVVCTLFVYLFVPILVSGDPNDLRLHLHFLSEQMTLLLVLIKRLSQQPPVCQHENPQSLSLKIQVIINYFMIYLK